jgi:hypothetical protein
MRRRITLAIVFVGLGLALGAVEAQPVRPPPPARPYTPPRITPLPKITPITPVRPTPLPRVTPMTPAPAAPLAAQAVRPLSPHAQCIKGCRMSYRACTPLEEATDAAATQALQQNLDRWEDDPDNAPSPPCTRAYRDCASQCP